MSTTHHTLADISVPRGMVWVDEFDWTPVEKALEYSITGALLIDVAEKQAGRPITLAAADDAGWITLAVLRQLQALAARVVDDEFDLVLADGREFRVQFAPDSPIEARPLGRPELPTVANPYVATLRLIEV